MPCPAAVFLGGLSALSAFHAMGETATLATRWKRWISEFMLYVMSSGVTSRAQQRALLLHVAGARVSDVYYTYDEPMRGAVDAGDFDQAVTCLENHFKEKTNLPMARQAFLHTESQPGETVNNFVTRLKQQSMTAKARRNSSNIPRQGGIVLVIGYTNSSTVNFVKRKDNGRATHPRPGINNATRVDV